MFHGHVSCVTVFHGHVGAWFHGHVSWSHLMVMFDGHLSPCFTLSSGRYMRKNNRAEGSQEPLWDYLVELTNHFNPCAAHLNHDVWLSPVVPMG